MTWPRARIVAMTDRTLVRVRPMAGPSGAPFLELTEIRRDLSGNVAHVEDGSRVRIAVEALPELVAAAEALAAEMLADTRRTDTRRARAREGMARRAAAAQGEF